MANPKTYRTIACIDGHHEFCPGWFREHVTAPWSNQPCDCACHRQEAKVPTAPAEPTASQLAETLQYIADCVDLKNPALTERVRLAAKHLRDHG